MRFNHWLSITLLALAVGCSSDNDPMKTVEKTPDAGGTPKDASVDPSDADAGSGEVSDAGTIQTPAITGSYVDNWGISQLVTASEWKMGTDVFVFTHVDNSRKFMIAKNAGTNAFNAGLFSRFDWTRDANQQLWYCQSAYAASSEQQAFDTPAANSADLAKGCGGFGWSQLISAHS